MTRALRHERRPKARALRRWALGLWTLPVTITVGTDNTRERRGESNSSPLSL